MLSCMGGAVELVDVCHCTAVWFALVSCDQHLTLLFTCRYVTAAVPDVPTNLQALATSPTSILVTWEAPSRGATVISYSVYYYDIGTAAPTEVEVNVTDGMSCLLTSLKKFHQYSVRVVGVNTNGVGVSTSEVLCRTHSDGKL
jgi:Fibronectin type III domain